MLCNNAKKALYNYVQLTNVDAEAYQNMVIKAYKVAWITLKACRIHVLITQYHARVKANWQGKEGCQIIYMWILI